MTKNEELAIAACLRSIPKFIDPYVVDSQSNDRTVEIARSEGATVLDFNWNGKYPKKKQWALEQLQATYEWVLFLDADERLSSALARRVESLTKSAPQGLDAFDFPIEYRFMNRTLRHGYQVNKRALLRCNRTRFPEIDDLSISQMWEVEGHYQPVVDGHAVRSRLSIVHDDPDPLFDYFARHNRYSDWDAQLPDAERAKIDKKDSRRKVFTKAPFKPLLFFCYAFVYRRGFLDGREGFDYAVAHAFYYWQISLKRREHQNQTSTSIR